MSEDEKKEFEQPSTGGLEPDQINMLLGSFKEEIMQVARANDEKIAGSLDVLSELVKNQNKVLDTRGSNSGGNNSGRSVIVKEPPLPKLSKDQKYEDWIKQVEEWLEEMGKCWQDREGLGPYSVRLMKEMFKECKNEEIRDYAMKFIVSNNECKTFDQIKEKLKFRFGKTEKQKDKEVRTKFKGSQLIGNIGEYVEFWRKQRKEEVESLNMDREDRHKVPEEGVDGWIVRDRLDEIREKNKLENYECDQLEKFCKDQKYDFEACMAEIVRVVSEKHLPFSLQ